MIDMAFDALLSVDEKIRTWHGEGDAPRFERFRGDGWQAVVLRPVFALRAACLFYAAARSVDRESATRIAVGIGRVSSFSGMSLGASDGEAFRLSGRLLDELPRSLVIGANVAAGNTELLSGWTEGAFQLAGVLCEQWTPKQAKVMCSLLLPDPPSQSQLGKQLGVTQQTVQRHFDSARGAVLLSAIERIEMWSEKTA